MNNTIYLRRRGRILLPSAMGAAPLQLQYVASAARNLETLGYGFSTEIVEACRLLSLEQLVAVYGELVEDLKHRKGAHQVFRPMYPNFPAQVMETSEVELYINAIIHYWTDGR